MWSAVSFEPDPVITWIVFLKDDDILYCNTLPKHWLKIGSLFIIKEEVDLLSVCNFKEQHISSDLKDKLHLIVYHLSNQCASSLLINVFSLILLVNNIKLVMLN